VLRACLLCACLLLSSVTAAADGWEFGSDLRAGVFVNQRDTRSGDRDEVSEARARIRAALSREIAPGWRFRGRVAGRFGTEQEATRVFLQGHSPTPTGTRLGDVTLDELYLDYAPDAAWSLRIGRFQTKFELMGVAAKSLDRNDSPSTDVSWTDGLHWRYRFDPGWQAHLVLQHNPARGSGTTARRPLDFADSGSRLALFSGLESTRALGPIVQRMIGVTWLPDALARDGVSAPAREDYLAITARLAAAWPIGADGRRWLLAAEAGHAPHTPRATVVGAGDGGHAGGNAWQASVNLENIRPGHHVGLVHGRADAGWLLSPDFRNNDRLVELRYQWRIRPNLSMEARIRRREEIDLPASAGQARVDRDLYLRLTTRF
jgi:hypothetical protein